MCGIVGYIGYNQASDILLEGLNKLEYRGYDSAGVAILNDKIEVRKFKGRLLNLAQSLNANPIKGTVGIGTGRAKEVPAAIDKATLQAKNNLKKINIVNGTIPHEVVGKYGTSKVLMLPAKKGCGVIAGGGTRAVLELAGVKDIVTKIHGSTNKINCVRATLRGLEALRTKEEVAIARGKSVEEI